MDHTLNQLYKTIYPERELKSIQLEIITKLITGNDIIAILATGFGKSICYQLPMLYFKKHVIVISPLIALMEDQQSNLNKLNIACTCLSSNLSHIAKSHEKLKISNNQEGIIIYITPESFIKEEFFIKDLIKNDNLCLIAIDESHCISTWGSDFRKDYQKLFCIKNWLEEIKSKVPIFACTATATLEVQSEIVKYLGLKDPIIIKSSFNRENLYLEYNKKNNVITDLSDILKDYKNDYVIIYSKTRDDTVKISEIVNELGINCKAYNGGMSLQERKTIQTEFIEGKFKCIIATLAFGMGIDQNIKLVVHYGLSSDIDSYVQEIGRAGRDGSNANCIMFWSDNDINTCSLLLEGLPLDRRKHKENQIRFMNKLARTDECRKKIILQYFGERIENCMNCDNCNKNRNVVEDIEMNNIPINQQKLHLAIFMIFKTIMTCERSGLGISRITDILRGSKNKATLEFNKLSTYSSCVKYKQDILKEIIKLLIFNNYLREIFCKFGSIITKAYKLHEFWSIYNDTTDISVIEWPTFNIPRSFNIIQLFLK